MPTVPIVTKTGPRSYTPAEFITGGQLVEARANSRVGVAGAGSLKVLGVAVTDAMNPDSWSNAPVMVNGRPVLDANPPAMVLSVADSGMEVPVVYAAAAAFGDKLVAASIGRVTPATSADVDPRAIVGRCVQPGGVASAGMTGLFRIE